MHKSPWLPSPDCRTWHSWWSEKWYYQVGLTGPIVYLKVQLESWSCSSAMTNQQWTPCTEVARPSISQYAYWVTMNMTIFDIHSHSHVILAICIFVNIHSRVMLEYAYFRNMHSHGLLEYAYSYNSMHSHDIQKYAYFAHIPRIF